MNDHVLGSTSGAKSNLSHFGTYHIDDLQAKSQLKAQQQSSKCYHNEPFSTPNALRRSCARQLCARPSAAALRAPRAQACTAPRTTPSTASEQLSRLTLLRPVVRTQLIILVEFVANLRHARSLAQVVDLVRAMWVRVDGKRN